eukprot:scaffold82121_cov35-Tisochrysis_lutea.AAC.1
MPSLRTRSELSRLAGAARVAREQGQRETAAGAGQVQALSRSAEYSRASGPTEPSGGACRHDGRRAGSRAGRQPPPPQARTAASSSFSRRVSVEYGTDYVSIGALRLWLPPRCLRPLP